MIQIFEKWFNFCVKKNQFYRDIQTDIMTDHIGWFQSFR